VQSLIVWVRLCRDGLFGSVCAGLDSVSDCARPKKSVDRCAVSDSVGQIMKGLIVPVPDPSYFVDV
jgi:hypothetical protein